MTELSGEPGPTAGPGDRLDGLSLLPYRLPLRRPWQSARGLFTERTGWLVRAESTGTFGYGDCAPLPEAGTETPSVASRVLELWRGELPGRRIEGALGCLLGANGGDAPAAQWALECALLDLESRLAGVPLRCWVLGAKQAPMDDRVPVNAPLGTCMDLTPESIREAVRAGYRVLKLKLGCADPDDELGHLASLAGGLPPGVRLRLDANGAWEPPVAERAIRALNDLPVESLEEPLVRPEPVELARLQTLAAFPLALDESLPRILRGSQGGGLPVRRAVIKPAVIGGVSATLGLAERLRRLGVEVVLTGIVDGAPGLWATVQVAAAIGSPLAQGLATWDWLAEDLGPPPIPRAGAIALPVAPGSGFSPYPRGPAGG